MRPPLVCLGLFILLAGCSQRQQTTLPTPSVGAEVKPVGSVAALRPPGAPRVLVTVDGALASPTEHFRLDGGRYEVA